jgi:hypothetical protein
MTGLAEEVDASLGPAEIGVEAMPSSVALLAFSDKAF